MNPVEVEAIRSGLNNSVENLSHLALNLAQFCNRDILEIHAAMMGILCNIIRGCLSNKIYT